MNLRFPVLTAALIFFTMLPVTMIVPVFKEIIKDRLGGNNLAVSYFMSIAMLGSFIFSPAAGYVSDRIRSRKWLISVFAVLDGLSLISLTFTRDLYVLQALRFAEGAFHIFVIGLLLALMADRENDPNNTRFYRKGIILGTAGTLLTLGVGIGSPMGILGRKNPDLPFIIAGIIMIFIGIVSSVFLKDYESRFQKKVSLDTWKSAYRNNPLVVIPCIYNFIDRFTVGFFVSIFSLHLREDLHLNPGQTGIFLSLVLIPMSLCSYPFAVISRKTNPALWMMTGSVIYGAALGLAGFAENTKVLAVLLLVCGVGAGVMFVPSMMLVSRLVPQELNATAMTVYTGIGSVGFMLGPISAVLLDEYVFSSLQKDIRFGSLALFFGMLEILTVITTLPFYHGLQEKKI